MDSEELEGRVRQMLKITQEIRDRTESPGLHCCLHDIEIACHLALNYLGQTDAIAPELTAQS